jgi:hypothetical protein
MTDRWTRKSHPARLSKIVFAKIVSIFCAPKRNDDVGMVVNVEADGLSWFEPDFPHVDMLALKHECVTDFAQSDPAIRRCL